jgi:glutamine synthetase
MRLAEKAETIGRPDMPGNLTFDQLKNAVDGGSIDTVLVASVDMWGRLMGKRFHAAFFVKSGWEETHCCDYLLTVDQDMNTVQGYKSSSWQTGYGDYVMKPDMTTLRLIPWLPGTALVLTETSSCVWWSRMSASTKAVPGSHGIRRSVVMSGFMT